MLVTTDAKLSRWREQFERVLNILLEVSWEQLDVIPKCWEKEDPAAIEEADIAWSCEPSSDEIREIIGQVKYGKAPGLDELIAEMLKLGAAWQAE